MSIKDNVLFILKTKPNGNIEEINFKRKFPEIYRDLSSWVFPNDFKFVQKLYHYFNNDKLLKLGLCPVCGKRCSFIKFNKGYNQHCSQKCTHLDKNIQDKFKNTCLELYGVEHPMCSDEIKEKLKQTFIKKYGVENYSSTLECKNKREQTNMIKYGHKNVFQSEIIKDKIKYTNIEHFGVDNYAKTQECQEKMKITCVKKYGVDNYSKTKEFNEKLYITKKNNNSFHTSKIENKFKKYLTLNNINYEYQYKSELYPFACDFYIPEYDLYIEIQGNWTHGFHPFDNNSDTDIKKLNIWKTKNTDYYKKAIDVWTQKDPIKRETAKNNNLNYLEIFSNDIEIVIEQFKKYILKLKG